MQCSCEGTNSSLTLRRPHGMPPYVTAENLVRIAPTIIRDSKCHNPSKASVTCCLPEAATLLRNYAPLNTMRFSLRNHVSDSFFTLREHFTYLSCLPRNLLYTNYATRSPLKAHSQFYEGQRAGLQGLNTVLWHTIPTFLCTGELGSGAQDLGGGELLSLISQTP